MGYKIYFGNHVFLLQEGSETEKYPDFTEYSSSNISSAVKKFLEGKESKIIISCTNPSADFETFRSHFTIIQAAGGIVKDELKRILFIFRRGKWDLPKGKLDKGETIPECAKREVEEECGIVVSEILDQVYTTYHIYEERGRVILKETFWYDMFATHEQKLIPQIEEDIHLIEWVKAEEQQKILANTYPMIRDIITSKNHKLL